MGTHWLLQGVARVLSKLPSLQSMTQRLRAPSHKAMLPGTVDEAKEEHRLVSSVSTSEAHVVVFVHGFRVSFLDVCAEDSLPYQLLGVPNNACIQLSLCTFAEGHRTCFDAVIKPFMSSLKH